MSIASGVAHNADLSGKRVLTNDAVGLVSEFRTGSHSNCQNASYGISSKRNCIVKTSETFNKFGHAEAHVSAETSGDTGAELASAIKTQRLPEHAEVGGDRSSKFSTSVQALAGRSVPAESTVSVATSSQRTGRKDVKPLQISTSPS
jgi:hypothetical protein